MGIFNKLKQMAGGVDAEVLRDGVPAQAVILAVAPTGTTVEVGNGLVQRVCEFGVQVIPDGAPEYRTIVRQRIPEIMLARIQPGITRIAAKVHPRDQQRVALDFDAPPPTVRYSGGGDAQHSAAHVLQTGQRGDAVIVSSAPLNMTNSQGVPLYAFELTIIPANGSDPFQSKTGMPTPAAALPLVFPGSRVPVCYLPENLNAVVIDWASAGVR
ncbi:MAG TPA: hypothetical protein VL551_10085 [Actinospica sp.]|nr:hypothetical protein [Actinospica sp.]